MTEEKYYKGVLTVASSRIDEMCAVIECHRTQLVPEANCTICDRSAVEIRDPRCLADAECSHFERSDGMRCKWLVNSFGYTEGKLRQCSHPDARKLAEDTEILLKIEDM